MITPLPDCRVGLGYDNHRLVEGLPLFLGGVSIPSPVGAEAHSDGDVLIHAIVDAFLGAIGAGDIGTHFSDRDPRWKGQASRLFLEEAAKMVKAKEQLASDFGTLVSDAEDLLKSTASYSGDTVAAARSRFQGTLDQFKTKLSDAQSAVVTRIDRTAATTQEYVEENPWKLMGAAVLVGVVVGLLLHRR